MSGLFLGFDIPAPAAAEEEEERRPPQQEFVHGPVDSAGSTLPRAHPTPAILRANLNVESRALTDAMRQELTLTPKTTDDRKPTPYPAYAVRGDVAAVPRYWGLATFGSAPDAAHDRTTRGDALPPSVAFAATLLAYQRAAVEHVVRTLTAEGTLAHGAMLVAGCGCGKTVMALAIAARLRRKTAILCHNSMLIEQWKERIGQFCPGAEVGVVQRDTVEVEGRHIVLFMIASVVSGRYDGDGFYDDFGLVIVDEAHHIAAKTFMQSLRRFPADARLGLTATPERRDGLGHAVEWVLGPVVYRVRRVTEAVEARILHHRRGATRELKRYGKPDYVSMVTRLCEDEARHDAICDVVRRLVDEGRYVIVLSDRRAHLAELHARLGDELSGVYAGESTKRGKRVREGSKDKRVMLATTKMGEEGLDVAILSAIVLATPKSGLGGLEQAIGRVLRSHPDKKCAPLIVDVVDPVSIFQGMARKRERFYREMGYSVSVGALTEAEAAEAPPDSKG
mgnify:CR=1 FL=1